MNKSKYRGHDIFVKDGDYYLNSGQLVSDNKDIDCGHCGLANTKDGHDGCIGMLNNVMNACCGHGDTNTSYIQFWDGTRISGKESIEYIKQHKL